MPKKIVGYQQTDTDVDAMVERLKADYPNWHCSIDIQIGPGDWYTITAYAGRLEGVDEVTRAQARVYHTRRSPSMITDVWKAFFGLHMQIERVINGLPPLIGY